MNQLLKRLFYLIIIFMALQTCGQSEMTNGQMVEEETTNIYPPNDIEIATHSEWTKTHYPKRINEFKKNPLQKGDIVFLGNSITEQGEDWELKIKNSKAKNRGIAGDTTDGVLARLEELIYYKPSQVFILIGINDLFLSDMSSQNVYDNIILMIKKIRKKNPQTEIFIHTILPTTTANLKPKIELTNTLLKNAEPNQHYKLIRLHKKFVNENGLMDINLSTDGVHLNDKGYQVWVNEIIGYIPE